MSEGMSPSAEDIQFDSSKHKVVEGKSPLAQYEDSIDGEPLKRIMMSNAKANGLPENFTPEGFSFVSKNAIEDPEIASARAYAQKKPMDESVKTESPYLADLARRDAEELGNEFDKKVSESITDELVYKTEGIKGLAERIEKVTEEMLRLAKQMQEAQQMLIEATKIQDQEKITSLENTRNKLSNQYREYGQKQQELISLLVKSNSELAEGVSKIG